MAPVYIYLVFRINYEYFKCFLTYYLLSGVGLILKWGGVNTILSGWPLLGMPFGDAGYP